MSMKVIKPLTLQTIKYILPHPMADYLEILYLNDSLVAIVGRDEEFCVGEIVIFIGPKTFIPDQTIKALGIQDLIKYMDCVLHIWDDESGAAHAEPGAVVRPANIRGVISQGIIMRYSDKTADILSAVSKEKDNTLSTTTSTTAEPGGDALVYDINPDAWNRYKQRNNKRRNNNKRQNHNKRHCNPKETTEINSLWKTIDMVITITNDIISVLELIAKKGGK